MSSTQHTRHKILIVEDDRFIAEMYAHALTGAGYNVTVAADGKSGFHEIKSDKFDLVLLDIMLPEQMGDQILREWRALRPKSVRPHIIVMTNYEQDEASRAAVKADADAYLIKADTTPRKLRDIIAEVLDN